MYSPCVRLYSTLKMTAYILKHTDMVYKLVLDFTTTKTYDRLVHHNTADKPDVFYARRVSLQRQRNDSKECCIALSLSPSLFKKNFDKQTVRFHSCLVPILK